MNFVDYYIVHILLSLPLLSAIFIYLIPHSDIASKKTIANFFSTVSVIAYLRLLILFLTKNPIASIDFSLNLYNLNFNLFMEIKQSSVLIYGLVVLSIAFHSYSQKTSSVKNSLHHSIPFILTFVLYVVLGQTDLKIALPILSITNFLIYFSLSLSQKNQRGFTIFQSGVFLLCYDTLALIVLQIYSSLEYKNKTVLMILLLAPGCARLLLPLFAPHFNKFIKNTDHESNILLTIFLQISGFSIILLVYEIIEEIPEQLSIIVNFMSLINAGYVTYLMIRKQDIKFLPHYLLIIFNAFTVMILFSGKEVQMFWGSTSMFINNVICFLMSSLMVKISTKIKVYSYHIPMVRSFWLLMGSLLIGLPGLGVGASLWPAIYYLIEIKIFYGTSSIYLWQVIIILWLVIITSLSIPLIKAINQEFTVSEHVIDRELSFISIKQNLVMITIFTAAASIVITLLINLQFI